MESSASLALSIESNKTEFFCITVVYKYQQDFFLLPLKYDKLTRVNCHYHTLQDNFSPLSFVTKNIAAWGQMLTKKKFVFINDGIVNDGYRNLNKVAT